MSAPLAKCVERWTSPQEARVQIRVSTPIIYSRADTVHRHKENSNIACAMHSGFRTVWTSRVPYKECNTDFKNSPQASRRFHRRLAVYT